MLARVVLRDSVRATDRLFDYSVPQDMSLQICVGQFVKVPFGVGNRTEIALVLETAEDNDTSFAVKPILSIIDQEPVLLPDQIPILSYMRNRYTCTFGDAVRLMVPSAVTSQGDKLCSTAQLADHELAVALLDSDEIDSLQQIRVLEYLIDYGPTPISELMSALAISRSPVTTLQKKGLLTVSRMPSKNSDIEDTCDTVEKTEPYPPSPFQKQAIDAILQPGDKREFLLFGVTGSGKTEVYLQCAAEIIARGGSVLFLVPEISLTPQMVCWIRGRFPGMTAVLHSRLTPKERFEQWDAIRRGKARIVVGARSAVFAPIHNLQLILVDEEQDSSYKSETHPRYHARDIARFRAAILNAACVLGSATPSIETYYSAQNGYSVLLNLPDRIADNGLPQTKIIDMREELRHRNRSVFSRELRAAMTDAFSKKEQVMLFLNKRGFASLLLCRACGEAVMCPHCSVAMTLHTPRRSGNPQLICHYCGLVQKVSPTCPSCGSKVHGKFGLGTEQLEELVRKEFPDQTVIRMDQDTTVGRDSHSKILSEFREGRASILVGTQMIAKGHDFPQVTVVGIIAADLLLRASDFRAAERSFQLITQAAGRAGRGEKAGKVFIQTYQPYDDTLRFAARQNYERFYEHEITYRKRLRYPPFCAIGSILISHPEEQYASRYAQEMKRQMEGIIRAEDRFSDVSLFGPSPSSLFKVKDRYRFVLNMKARNKSDLAAVFRKIAEKLTDCEVRISMDIDPIW